MATAGFPLAFRRRAIRYPVEALLRGPEPGARSLTDTRDLVHLVRYLAEGSGIRLVVHTAGGSGRVSVWFDVFGDGADALSGADLDHACALSLVLGGPETVGPDELPSFSDAYELKRIAAAPLFAAPAPQPLSQDWSSGLTSSSPVLVTQPKPSLDPSGQLLGALGRSAHDVWVVTALMSASTLDAGFVLDEIDSMTSASGRVAHAGAIVCARTVVLGSGPLSPTILAALAKRSPEMEAVASDPTEAARLLVDPVGALRGHAVAERHAISLARVPTTANGAGIGIASRLPDPHRRALDPSLPPPTTPVRVGSAYDIAGDPVDVELDVSDLKRHTYVEGKSGSGKSAYLKAVGVSWLEAGHPLITIDPHGDVAQELAARAGALGQRVFYIRHGDLDHPIGMNLLSERDPEFWEQNVDALLESMARIIDPGSEGMFGERAKRTFWLVAKAARDIYRSRLTIHVVQTLLLRKEFIRDLARATRATSPDISRRLVTELVDLGDKEWTELVSWFLSRFQMWQRTRALRDTMGTGVDAIDMIDVLEGRAHLIVDLASMQLGDPVAGIIGGLYLRKIREAMGRRSSARPVLLQFDEAHLFHDEAPDRLLAEGRKYGLALMIASQSADNLTPRLARAVEANVGSFISLRTGINLAANASTRLGGWPAAELTRLPDLTAAASLSARGVPTDPFTLRIDHYARSARDGWTAERIAEGAEEAAARTLEELWQPYSAARVPTDSEIVSFLRASLDAEEGRDRGRRSPVDRSAIPDARAEREDPTSVPAAQHTPAP